jgi:chromosome partitioning protein
MSSSRHQSDGMADDSMAVVAVYSLKGGVGKTTLAVNLAWASATLSSRRTLLWDLDPQAGSSFILGDGKANRDAAHAVFSKDVPPEKLIQRTRFDRLDLLAADTSLRNLDRFFFDLGKKKRLARLLETLGRDYDRVILDCPPGLTETSEQVMRAATAIIVPVIPSPLSHRALDEVVAFLGRQNGRHAPILPVYSMVDRRRSLHRAGLDEKPDWPVIPMASAIEQMAAERAPVAAFAPKSPAADAFAALWRGIERRLTKA